MGDFGIDIKKANSTAYDKLEEFCDTFNNHKSTIDLILTNNPRSFQITYVTETCVSDSDKLITTL